MNAEPLQSALSFIPSFPDLLFYVLALLIVASAGIVTFSRDIVHSGFALLGTFSGVAGIYALTASNFLAAIQLLVYVGGVLIVILFAIMLTRGIQSSRLSNPSSGIVSATGYGIIIAGLLIYSSVVFPWKVKPIDGYSPQMLEIGVALLTKYLIPFELLSVVLLAVLIGSVMLIRKEIRSAKISGDL